MYVTKNIYTTNTNLPSMIMVKGMMGWSQLNQKKSFQKFKKKILMESFQDFTFEQSPFRSLSSPARTEEGERKKEIE